MTIEIRYKDYSALDRPKDGLPGRYVFAPGDAMQMDRDRSDEIAEVKAWCGEQFGKGRSLNGPAERLDESGWGWWDSGTLFFASYPEAMWFKIRWC